MDKKIRAAAGNDHHGYEDKDWQKMEMLLNKHLPQQKDRRKGIIFFLLAGLLLSTAIYFMSRHSSPAGKRITEQEHISSPATTQKQDTGSAILLPADNHRNKKTPAEQKTGSPTGSLPPAGNRNEQRTIASYIPHKLPPVMDEKMNITLLPEKPAVPGDASFYSTDGPDRIQPTDRSYLQQDTGTVKSGAPVRISSSAPTQAKEPSLVSPQDTAGGEKRIAGVPHVKPADSSVVETPGHTVVDNKQRSKPSGLSFMVSAGPDISGVAMKPGRVQLQYGIGIGYSFSERLTLRTGFYATRKIYSADSSNYKTPYSSGPYSYRLYDIDANCLVYEIPVTLSYNFAASNKHNWFIAGGLSSYIMKKEAYDYTYKNSTGQTWLRSYNYKNERSHLFSVVNLSGGYQYNFSKRFSLLAEPYIKLPVSGIGFGKVKLNSAGILFTASFRPL